MNPQEDIRDIKPWIALAEVPWWVLVAALLLALGAGYWLWRRRRKKPMPIAQEAVEPPGPTPWERLLALRGAAVEEAEAIRCFHFDLSEFFRAALEQRFNFPASDRTTEELKRGLRGVVTELGKVMAVLEAADRVKFTDYRPSPLACRELLQEAIALVESWRPQVEVAAPASRLVQENQL